MSAGLKLTVMPGLALAICLKLSARDLSSMYDTATLQQRAPHYRATTNKILNEFVYKYLTSEEKRRLTGIPIDYPLTADAPMKGDPLAFYGPPDHSRVVFPIFSIKFLDDLSTAYAWLQVNGYVLDTITEYTAMLEHKDLGGRYPAPLPALHIPADALGDKRVDELALDHFVTARMFILLHELGHIYYGHEGSSVAHEVQADRFAIDVMRRSPVPPLGMLVYFMAEASMAEYPATARTHPLSGARMQALGVAMQDPQIAMVLGDLGKLVDDPDVRASHVLTARATNLQSLTPRRGHVPALTASTGGSHLFQGRCSGQLIQRTNPGEPMAMEMVLERTGDNVTGQFSVGLGVATIKGTAARSTLNLDWQWANNYGRGTLRATDDGARLTGEWGFRESNRGGGTWSCHRVD